jgi:hypothetical protein
MINLELNLDYKKSDDDEVYRDQFLQFFMIDEYNEEKIKNIQLFVFTHLKNNDKFKIVIDRIKEKYSQFSEEHAYMILYSFENFDIFSKIIKNVYNKTLSDDDFKELENNISIE